MRLKILILLLVPCFASAQTGWYLSGDTLRYNDGAGKAVQINKTGLFMLKTDTVTLSDRINSKQAAGSYATGNGSATGSNTGDNAVNTLYSGLAASKQDVITVLPFANGGITGVTATSATTGTISVPMTSRIITITPTGACTFNATGGVAGQMVTFVITTSGVSSFTLTFGTNFKKVGTLATGATSARFFTVTFIYDGIFWYEAGRTAVQS